MDKQFLRYLQISFQLLDLFMLNIVVMIAKTLFNANIPDAAAPVYFHYLIYLNLTWIGLSWLSQVYSWASISTFEVFTKKTARLYLLWLCGVMIYLFFYRQTDLSRFFIITSLGIFALCLLLNRFTYIVIRDLSKNREQLSKRILIIGYNPTAKALVQKLEKGAYNKIVGFVADPETVTELTPYPVVGRLTQTISLSEELKVNQIFSTVSPEQDKGIYTLMQRAEAKFIRFRIVPDLSFFIKRPVHVEFFEGLPMIALRREPLEDIGNRAKKRAVDVVISFFVVVFVLSWLIPLLGLLIYLESPGPVFFPQLRSGRNNKPFRCLKFRSMKVNNDTGVVQATKNDSRITKIGAFIRKTSLDEFPQFWNVLKGEMSLVGPRPHALQHTEEFSKIVDTYMIRQFLKPGITGWAQVNGFRGEIHGNEHIIGRVECDLWYSQYWNPWLDFRIMFLTVYNVFKGEENAY